MKTLAQIYQRYKGNASFGDKGTVHSYIEVYERLLAPYRQTAQRVLEIGILNGQSLRMWEEYFDQSEVHGIDTCLQPLGMADLGPMIAEGGHHISLLDATNLKQVAEHFGGMTFDVIIEDASHALSHQLAIYANFKASLSADGIYVIEDVDDLDSVRSSFETIDASRPVRILDRRWIKGRYDDVLVIIGGKNGL